MSRRKRSSKYGQWLDPAAATLAFVNHWLDQFKLFTRSELKTAAAQVAAAYQANLGDRGLAVRFMIITTALKRSHKAPAPSVIKRLFFLWGGANQRLDKFLADPFVIPAIVSDAELMDIITHGHYSRRVISQTQAQQEYEPTRMAHFAD